MIICKTRNNYMSLSILAIKVPPINKRLLLPLGLPFARRVSLSPVVAIQAGHPYTVH